MTLHRCLALDAQRLGDLGVVEAAGDGQQESLALPGGEAVRARTERAVDRQCRRRAKRAIRRRVMEGESSPPPPPPRCGPPSTNSSGGMSLSRKPVGSGAQCTEDVLVEVEGREQVRAPTAAASGLGAATWLPSPSIPGMRTSSSATWAAMRSRRASSLAARRPSPTTWMSAGSLEDHRATPARTSAWSSTSTTEITAIPSGSRAATTKSPPVGAPGVQLAAVDADALAHARRGRGPRRRAALDARPVPASRDRAARRTAAPPSPDARRPARSRACCEHVRERLLDDPVRASGRRSARQVAASPSTAQRRRAARPRARRSSSAGEPRQAGLRRQCAAAASSVAQHARAGGASRPSASRARAARSRRAAARARSGSRVAATASARPPGSTITLTRVRDDVVQLAGDPAALLAAAAASARASAAPEAHRARTSWLRPTTQAPVNSSAGAVRSVIVASAVRAAPSRDRGERDREADHGPLAGRVGAARVQRQQAHRQQERHGRQLAREREPAKPAITTARASRADGSS